jgi:hypothetical protein
LFLGMTSTALLEAGFFGRCALQLYDPIFLMDDLEELNCCYSCAPNRLAIKAKLQMLIASDFSPHEVDRGYVKMPADYRGEWLEQLGLVFGGAGVPETTKRSLPWIGGVRSDEEYARHSSAHSSAIEIKQVKQSRRYADALQVANQGLLTLPARLDLEHLQGQGDDLLPSFGAEADALAAVCGSGRGLLCLAVPGRDERPGWWSEMMALMGGFDGDLNILVEPFPEGFPGDPREMEMAAILLAIRSAAQEGVLSAAQCRTFAKSMSAGPVVESFAVQAPSANPSSLMDVVKLQYDVLYHEALAREKPKFARYKDELRRIAGGLRRKVARHMSRPFGRSAR